MNFIVNLPILLGLIFTSVALITKRYPPQKINMNYGYRTKRSMKNLSVWNYAQSIYPRVLLKGGIGLIITGLVLWLMGSSQPVVVIAGIIGMFSVIIILFVRVEGKLKHFESENNTPSNS